MKTVKMLFLLLPFVFASCGKHLVVNFSDNPTNSGSLNLLPSRQLSGASLTVDGKLLVEREYVRKITVLNIPLGEHHFHFTCDNSSYKDKVQFDKSLVVKAGEERTELIEVPPHSTGYWINSGLYTAGVWGALVLLWVLNDDSE